jgi:hypothetical protein
VASVDRGFCGSWILWIVDSAASVDLFAVAKCDNE